MEPIAPEPRVGWESVVYAKDQPEYIPLPVNRTDTGELETKWKLTWWERWRVLWHGTMYIHILTFNQRLQPIKVMVDREPEPGPPNHPNCKCVVDL
jgi:hypothetical protein